MQETLFDTLLKKEIHFDYTGKRGYRRKKMNKVSTQVYHSNSLISPNYELFRSQRTPEEKRDQEGRICFPGPEGVPAGESNAQAVTKPIYIIYNNKSRTLFFFLKIFEQVYKYWHILCTKYVVLVLIRFLGLLVSADKFSWRDKSEKTCEALL